MKFKLDDKTWKETRFTRLCTAMCWDRPTALGVLTLFWYGTRCDKLVTTTERAILEYLPCDTQLRPDLLRAMEQGGYVKRDRRGEYTIEGNAAHIARIAQLSNAGRAGQAETMRRLRKRAALVDALQPAGPPETPLPKALAQQCSIPGIEALPDPKADVEAACWATYDKGYRLRYGTRPGRADRAQSVMRFFMERTGLKQAEATLRYFLCCDKYVPDKHALHWAIRDAERLRDLMLAACARAQVQHQVAGHG